MAGPTPSAKVVVGEFGDKPGDWDGGVRYQKVREAALSRRESAERLTEDLGIIFCAFDCEGRMTFHNRAWVEFYERNGPGGGSRMPTVGDKLAEPVVGDDLSVWQARLHEVLAGERPYWEEVMACHAPNQPRWMLERVQRYGGELVLSLYFLRSYDDEKPKHTRLRCLFTDQAQDAGWTLSGHAAQADAAFGLSPECSLQVYQWLRGN